MKNLILFSFITFSILCVGQGKEDKVNHYTYAIGNRGEKAFVFDKNENIIIRSDFSDFRNHKNKAKDYLFDKGIIYHKNDSIGFYKGREIHIHGKNFIYKNPLFKSAGVYDLDTKDNIFIISRKKGSLDIKHLQETEENSYFEALSYYAISKKVRGVPFKRIVLDIVGDIIIVSLLIVIL